jgi:hypothetical protein
MKPREWYRAEIRWAVMVEGKQGLREWEDAVHFFLAADEASAFQQALEIGRREHDGHEEGRRWVEKRLARIVSLECLGANQTAFAVRLGFRQRLSSSSPRSANSLHHPRFWPLPQ